MWGWAMWLARLYQASATYGYHVAKRQQGADLAFRFVLREHTWGLHQLPRILLPSQICVVFRGWGRLWVADEVCQ